MLDISRASELGPSSEVGASSERSCLCLTMGGSDGGGVVGAGGEKGPAPKSMARSFMTIWIRFGVGRSLTLARGTEDLLFSARQPEV